MLRNWGEAIASQRGTGGTISAVIPTTVARQASSGASSTVKDSTKPALVTKDRPSVARKRRLAGYAFALCSIYPMTSSGHVPQAPVMVF